MEEEFNLSEKRKKLLEDTITAFALSDITIEDVFDKIEEQDREFIGRLKKEVNNKIEGALFFQQTNQKLAFKDLLDKINKLAGKKLK